MPRHGTNIRKRADGRWEGRYKVPQSDTSCRYRSVYGKTCREVKEKLESITVQNKLLVLEAETKKENDAESSQEIPEDFHAIAAKWLECIKETRKYSTYIKYQGIYERHVRDKIGGVPVHDITHSLVNKRIFKGNSEASYSQNLRHSIIALINQILRYAAEHPLKKHERVNVVHIVFFRYHADKLHA